MVVLPDWIAFRLWYGDGSNYTGKSYADWRDAPVSDVQVVVFYLKNLDWRGDHEKVTYNGLDYYAMDRHGKVTSSVEDITEVAGHILSGSSINFNKYVEILEAANRDNGEGWLIPKRPKSKYLKGED